MTASKRPLMAVDGDSLAHRAYHGLPKTISRAGGRPAGALVGFSNFLMRLWDTERPRAVVVGWDTLESPTYRHDELPGYQAGRVFDDALLEQLAMLPELVEAFGFRSARAAGYEADDFLGAAAAAEEKRRGTCVVVTSDRDAFQLVSPRTTVLRPVKGVFELDRVDPARVVALYGVEPAQVPDFIALRGDPSDKIPGAKGVGPKTAAAVLQEYGTLEAALAANRFAAQAEDLRLYRRIATFDASAPLPSLSDQTPTWAEASLLAGEWGMKALSERLAERANA
jgi:5'-3' exonuclease